MEPETESDPSRPAILKPARNITPAERIKELNSIDQDISKILHSASSAIRALTTAPSSLDSTFEKEEVNSPLERRKEIFESHTREFYAAVQSVSAHLRRQTYALEEAGIIAAEPSSAVEMQGAPQAPKQVQQLNSRPGPGMAGGAQAKPEGPMLITNGGLGNLDVGWLNSRRDVVGQQKEAELWRDARLLLEKVDSKPDEDSMELT